MAPTLLAMLVGVGVPYFVARKFAERNPGWVGVAVSLALACAAGVVALFMLAFAAGFLLEHYMNLFDVRLDTGAWLNGLARGSGVCSRERQGAPFTADAEQPRSVANPIHDRNAPLRADQKEGDDEQLSD